jgi:hypothetical protein
MIFVIASEAKQSQGITNLPRSLIIPDVLDESFLLSKQVACKEAAARIAGFLIDTTAFCL